MTIEERLEKCREITDRYNRTNPYEEGLERDSHLVCELAKFVDIVELLIVTSDAVYKSTRSIKSRGISRLEVGGYAFIQKLCIDEANFNKEIYSDYLSKVGISMSYDETQLLLWHKVIFCRGELESLYIKEMLDKGLI